MKELQIGKIKDLTGKRYERLKVFGFKERKIRPSGCYAYYWNCVCDCGKEVVIDGNYLKIRKYYKLWMLLERKTTHGMTNTRLYNIWHTMKSRCLNKNDNNYKNYGGRRIKLCEEWTSFDAFFEWSLNNGYNDKLNIDRFNVNGNYCPENCRWTDIIDRNNNKNVNVSTIMDLCRLLNCQPGDIMEYIPDPPSNPDSQ